jgi:hypothetical protein
LSASFRTAPEPSFAPLRARSYAISGSYHFGRAIPDEAVFSECLSEIERLASAKFNGRGLDENGGISLGPADLARYGFGGVVRFDIAAE